MKTAALLFLSLALSGWAMPSSAHDPKEHQQQEAAAADCSKMKDMDPAKMDMSDPVTKALHAKCKKQMEHDAMAHGHNADGSEKSPTASSAGATGKTTTPAVDCSKMKDMDVSKMDLKDPAMKALHDKCMKSMNHDMK